jgi:hypothetical protein
MNVNDLIRCNYIKNYDIHDQDRTLTMRAVVMEEMPSAQGTEEKGILYFNEVKKGLILSKPVLESIARLYGPDIEKWFGQRVTLCTEEVNAFGKTHLCVRVRPKVPAPNVKHPNKQSKPAAQPSVAGPAEPAQPYEHAPQSTADLPGILLLIEQLPEAQRTQIQRTLEHAQGNDGDLVGLRATIEAMVEQSKAEADSVLEKSAQGTAEELYGSPSPAEAPPEEAAPIVPTETIEWGQKFIKYMMHHFSPEAVAAPLKEIMDTFGLESADELVAAQEADFRAAMGKIYRALWNDLCEALFEAENQRLNDEQVVHYRTKMLGSDMLDSEHWDSSKDAPKLSAYQKYLETLDPVGNKVIDTFEGELV